MLFCSTSDAKCTCKMPVTQQQIEPLKKPGWLCPQATLRFNHSPSCAFRGSSTVLMERWFWQVVYSHSVTDCIKQGRDLHPVYSQRQLIKKKPCLARLERHVFLFKLANNSAWTAQRNCLLSWYLMSWWSGWVFWFLRSSCTASVLCALWDTLS